MTHEDDGAPGLERRAIALVAVLILAPVLMCGFWTPLAHGLGVVEAVAAPVVQISGLLTTLAAVLGLRLERRLGRAHVSLGLAAVVAILVAMAATNATARVILAGLSFGVGSCGRLVYQRFVRTVPRTFDGKAKTHKLLSALWTVTALAAVVQTTRLSTFMTDATRVEASMIPGVEFMERHTCLSAYAHGAKMAAEGAPNVYVDPYQEGENPLRTPLPAGAEYLGHFTLDPYGYPPPFLLLPRALSSVSENFAVLRALWFLLSALAAAIGLVAIARWLGGRAEHQVFKFGPLFWMGMPTLVGLQLGNFQIATVFMALLSMVAFDRKRNRVGGLLLAFAALAKFAPGLLGIVLLAQRRYKAAAWTLGWGGLLIALSLVVLGTAPWEAFLTYHLPRVQSGEALGFLDDNVDAIAGNLSVFGLPFKLGALGVPNMDWGDARMAANVFSVFLLAVAWHVGRKNGDRGFQLCMWAGLITLGALRSPFAPGHVLLGGVVTLLVLTREARTSGHRVALVCAWIIFSVVPPIPNPTALLVVSLLRQAVLIGVLGWVVVRRATEMSVEDRASDAVAIPAPAPAD